MVLEHASALLQYGRGLPDALRYRRAIRLYPPGARSAPKREFDHYCFPDLPERSHGTCAETTNAYGWRLRAARCDKSRSSNWIPRENSSCPGTLLKRLPVPYRTHPKDRSQCDTQGYKWAGGIGQ